MRRAEAVMRAALLSALLLLAACAGPRSVTYYLPPLPDEEAAAAVRSPVTVAVESFRVAPAYDTTQITFRSAPAVLERFSFHEWAADPGWMLASLTARRLEARFERVAAPDAPAPAQVLVGGIVSLLEADYRDEDVVRVRLTVELEARPAGGEARLQRAAIVGEGPDLAAAVARLGPLYAAEVDRLAATIVEMAGAPVSRQ